MKNRNRPCNGGGKRRRGFGDKVALSLAFTVASGFGSPAAWAVEDATVVTQTQSHGFQNNVPGTFVATRTMVYHFVLTPLRKNVAAVYRAAHRNWIDNMAENRIGYEGASVGYNADLVEEAIGSVGWDTLLSYVWQNVEVQNNSKGIVKKQQFSSLEELKSAADTQETFDWSWNSSIEAILIDLDKTGPEAIIGTVPFDPIMWQQEVTSLGVNADLKNLKSAMETRSTVGETNLQTFRLSDNSTVDIDLKGLVYTVSPIILDLSGVGKPDLLSAGDWALKPGRKLAAQALRSFDLDGSGGAIWEWVGPWGGLLVWDPDGSGQIRSGKQLFGNVTWGKRWAHGYQPLATLDQDKDGSLQGLELAKIAVWTDLNSNAISDPGEVQALSALGISALSVRARIDAKGNACSPGGVLLTNDGVTIKRNSWDWISMGVPKRAGGTYKWSGNIGQRPIGGYLHLGRDGTVVRGVSLPISPVGLQKKKVVTAIPLRGRIENQRLRWLAPAPKGSRVESEVAVEQGGKHLVGRTKVSTPKSSFTYNWQADLVSGKGLDASGDR